MSRGLSVALLLLLSLATVAEAGKRYALIVGVKTYRPGQPLPELAYTENDADGLAEVLKAGGYDVTLMTQTVGRVEGKGVFNPLSDYIRDQLSAILDNPFLKDDDVVVVALAGHGVQYELVDDAGMKTPKFFFCPADADVAKLKTANDITDRNRLIDLGELYTALKNCRAGGKLLLVDACRNDPTKRGVARALASATLPALPPPPGGTAAFFSCSAHQQAFEDKDLKHGVFFHHVIQALKGDADSSTPTRSADQQITLAELSEHVSATTYDFVRKKYQGAKQAPELKGEFRLSIPLVTLARVSAIPGPVPMPTPSTTPELARDIVGTKAGEVREFAGELKVKMCWCPSGSFVMGSPASEADRRDNEDQVNVTLSRGFWLGQTEVTQGLWESVMGTTPWVEHRNEDDDKVGANYAAVYINHGLGAGGTVEKDSATEFCRKLTARERAAGRLPEGWEYTLPTEAQWEYACRAGTKTAYSFGNDATQLSDYGWWGGYYGDGNAREERYAHTVATKKPNAWGLFDMHGSVTEWCQDSYGDKLPGGRDPQGPSRGSVRVIRGGSWPYDAGSNRSAVRGSLGQSYRLSYVGFRLVLSPSGP
ncbi:MAG: SUMF1/EgtB/PvdO family nonheme iron enzyme [Planctomycetaceae bacterium]